MENGGRIVELWGIGAGEEYNNTQEVVEIETCILQRY
jgi:hypothetical protein